MLVEPTLRFLLPKVSNHLPRQAVIQIILKHVKISTLVATVAPAPAKKWRQLAATGGNCTLIKVNVNISGLMEQKRDKMRCC